MHQSPRGVRRGKQQRRGVEHKIALVAESLCDRRTHPDHGNDYKAEHRHLMVDRTCHSLTSPLLSRLESKSLHFLNYTALLSIKQTFCKIMQKNVEIHPFIFSFASCALLLYAVFMGTIQI